jgi:hypothetical protein
MTQMARRRRTVVEEVAWSRRVMGRREVVAVRAALRRLKL